MEPKQPFYGTFRDYSTGSGHSYLVEIRSLTKLENSCECPGTCVNELGSSKHIEAVLARLRRGRTRMFQQAALQGSPRIEIFLSRNGSQGVRCLIPAGCPTQVRELIQLFSALPDNCWPPPVEAVPTLERAISRAGSTMQYQVRLAGELKPWVQEQIARHRRLDARNQFLEDVRQNKRTLDVVKQPLYRYQREGMLHLAFGARAMLADEMGLGKAVQAIATCELLRRLHRISKALVVSPVSLKAEWEKQIHQFCDLPARIIFGSSRRRLEQYRDSSFFYLCN